MSDSPKCIGCKNVIKIGEMKLANGLREIEYPEVKENLKKTKITYNLGNDIIPKTQEEAIIGFLKREFPQILKYREKPHPAITFPDEFSYGSLTSQMVTTEEGRQEIGEENRKALEKKDLTLAGASHESIVFYKLKDAMTAMNTKNTLLINSWKDNGNKERNQRELDFLLIADDPKLILHIEVKKTFSENTFKKGLVQLEGGYDYLKKTIPFPKVFGWTYVKALHFAISSEIKSDTFCNKCKPYILEEDTDYQDWLAKLFSKLTPTQPRHKAKDETYLNISKFLLNQMFQQKDSISMTDQLNEVNEAIEKTTDTIEKIFFWTKVQYEVIRFLDCKRLALTSTFGTGKTIILKAKAKSLLDVKVSSKSKAQGVKKKKVVIIIFNDGRAFDDSLLLQSYHKEFLEYKDLVEICRLQYSGKSTIITLQEIINQNKDSHIFLDECLVGKYGISAEDLNKLAKDVNENTFFWVACQSENVPIAKYLSEFQTPQIVHPLRYTSNILKISQSIRSKMGGTCFPPPTVNPDHYLNKGPKTQFFSLEPDTNLACAVHQLSHALEMDRMKTIIKIDFEQESITNELSKSKLKDRLIMEGEDDAEKKFLDIQKSDSIFVLGSRDNSLIRGFEVPILVHFTAGMIGDHVQSVYSRCKVKLYIICNEEYVIKILGRTFDPKNPFANITPVSDTMMPESFESDIKQNNVAGVQELLEDVRGRSLPINTRNEASKTALMIACENGSTEVVDLLLEKGADQTETDLRGWNACHFATANGNLNILQKLISTFEEDSTKNTNIPPWQYANEAGYGLIHFAAERGFDSIIKYLVDNQYFSLNDRTLDATHRTPLIIAAYFNQATTIKFLLELGTDPQEFQYDNEDQMSHPENEEQDNTQPLQTGQNDFTNSFEFKRKDTAWLDDDDDENYVVNYGENYAENCAGNYVGSYGENAAGNYGGSYGENAAGNYGGSYGENTAGNYGGGYGENAAGNYGGSYGENAAGNGGSYGENAAGNYAGGYGENAAGNYGESYGENAAGNYGGSYGENAAGNYGGGYGENAAGNYGGSYGENAAGNGGSYGEIAAGNGGSYGENAAGNYGGGYEENDAGNHFESYCDTRKGELFHRNYENGMGNVYNFDYEGEFDNEDETSSEESDKENDDRTIEVNNDERDENSKYQDSKETVKSAIHVASEKGFLHVIKELAEGGADVMWPSGNLGKRALHFAADNNHLDVIKYLVDEIEVDPNIRDDEGRTAFTYASQKGHLEIVRYLANNDKININLRDERGATALDFASEQGYTEVVKILIEGRAKVNSKDFNGQTSLHIASEKGHLSVVKLLVEEGNAKVDIKDTNGCTPLHFAIGYQKDSIAEYLVKEAKVNVNEKIEEGQTALHIVALKGFIHLAKFLIECKINVDEKDDDGETALHIATYNEDLKMIKILIEEGKANVNAQNNDGDTALHSAAGNENLKIVKYLLKEANAKVDIKNNDDGVALRTAIFNGNFNLVKFLVSEANANVNVRDIYGNTPLHQAVYVRSLKIAQFLVIIGNADISIENFEGKNPFDLAVETTFIDFVNFIYTNFDME